MAGGINAAPGSDDIIYGSCRLSFHLVSHVAKKISNDLANQYYALGELALVKAVLRQSGPLHPDSVLALNNLANVLSEQRRDGDALPIIDQAVHSTIVPSFASVWPIQKLIFQRMGTQLMLMRPKLQPCNP